MTDSQEGYLLGGRYRIGKVIGRGGVGTVYEADDTQLNRPVAAREVRLSVEPDDDQRAELARVAIEQARGTIGLTHPSIVAVYDVIDDGVRLWIVMQPVPGRSLEQAVKTDGPWAPADVARLGLDIVRALGAAHAAGVVHGDVQPSNVLVGPDGAAMLTDFSITHTVGVAGSASGGAVTGSPVYVAPERIVQGPTAPPTDLFGLGATLFFAVEGESPFHATDSMAAAFATAIQPHPRPEHAGPLTTVIDGLLEKDPHHRLSLEAARIMIAGVVGADVLSDGVLGADVLSGGVLGGDVLSGDVLSGDEDEPALVDPSPPETDADMPDVVTAAAIFAEVTETEVTDTEVTDTEVTDTEKSDTDTPDIEPPDTDADHADAADIETPDAEVSDTEVPEVADAEVADAEVADAEVADISPADIEASDTDVADVTAADIAVPDIAVAVSNSAPRHRAASTGTATSGSGRGWRRGRLGLIAGGIVVVLVVAVAAIAQAVGNAGTPLAAPSRSAASTPGATPSNGPKTSAATNPTLPSAGPSSPPAKPRVTGLIVYVTKGSTPGCQATTTATVNVSAGPVTVTLAAKINGVNSQKTVTFGPGGAQSKWVYIGAAGDSSGGTVRITATTSNGSASNGSASNGSASNGSASNSVQINRSWSSVPACLNGFTAAMPTVQCKSGGGLTMSIAITLHNAPSPDDVKVRFFVNGGFGGHADGVLDPETTQTLSTDGQGPYTTGPYQVYAQTSDANHTIRSATVTGTC